MDLRWLVDQMVRFRNDIGLVWNNHNFSYGELLDRFEYWRNKISAERFRNLSIFCLEGDYSLDVCGLMLALIEAGKVIVPLTAAAKDNREEFWKIAEVQVVLKFADAETGTLFFTGTEAQNPLTIKLIESGDPGLVLFSSGSTGKPKAALHNFSKILEKFKISRNRLTTLSFLLFDHIGGINTLFYTLSNGGTLVTTDNRNPEAICELVQKHQIELLPTTPTFLNMLLISESYQRFDLSSLKLITYGTEMMPQTVLDRLNRLLPGAQLLQTYGLSEVGILRSKSKSNDSLWVKIGGEGVETKVVDGILWIRSQSAMVGYLNTSSPITDDGWFITGDMVEVDGDYFRFRGRSSELINVGGEKVYPAEVENILMKIKGVDDAVVSGLPDPILGNIVTAKVKLNTSESQKAFRLRMRKFCMQYLSKYKIPQRIEIMKNSFYSERFKKLR